MEAVIATVVLVVLIGAALTILARSWPRSSRLGGYTVWKRGAGQKSLGLDEERGEANREDDDDHWRWDDRQGGEDAERGPRSG